MIIMKKYIVICYPSETKNLVQIRNVHVQRVLAQQLNTDSCKINDNVFSLMFHT